MGNEFCYCSQKRKEKPGNNDKLIEQNKPKEVVVSTTKETEENNISNLKQNNINEVVDSTTKEIEENIINKEEKNKNEVVDSTTKEGKLNNEQKEEDSKKEDKKQPSDVLKEEDLKKKKEEIEKKYKDLQSDIKSNLDELNKYYNEKSLNIENINSKISETNDVESIYLNYINLNRKLEIKENVKNEIKEEINNIKTLLETFKFYEQEKIESIYKIIVDNLLKIENILKNNDKDDKTKQFIENINNISKEIQKLEEINKKLKENNNPETKKKIEEIEKIIKDKLDKYNIAKNEYDILFKGIKVEPKIDDKFINNSMLISENNITHKNSFIDDNLGKIVINNYNEICSINDEYDLYEKNYEYQAVGLISKRSSLQIEEISFVEDKIIKIIEFTIDNEQVEFNFENSKLRFKKISLKNDETKKIYIKYEQSNILNENQKKQRKIYREDLYGILPNKNLIGKRAIFKLIINNNMEIISFDDEIFKKISEKEYEFNGKISDKGKYTRVILSKKSGKFNVCYTKKIESIEKKNIEDAELKLHFYFEEGGNKNNIINIIRETNPPNYLKNINKEERQYLIQFKNLKQKYAEVIIKGDLNNNCKGDWKCDLTEEQIDNKIPEDFKNNKDKLKEIANNIINEYNEEHKNDNYEITDIAKIGKWVKNNIKYDENEKSLNPMEIYNKKKGVCKQYTILFNALLYSLGYKCIYVCGFAIQDNDSFDSSDSHSWSLVRVNGKWLPFDATWGIFSGKLTVGHIFEDYFLKKNKSKTIDKLINKDEAKGKFIE